jgi:SagB-type dehydrogenase family enzyme
VIVEFTSAGFDVLIQLSGENRASLNTFISEKTSREKESADKNNLFSLGDILDRLTKEGPLHIDQIIQAKPTNRIEKALTVMRLEKMFELGWLDIRLLFSSEEICTLHSLGSSRMLRCISGHFNLHAHRFNYLTSGNGWHTLRNPMIPIEVMLQPSVLAQSIQVCISDGQEIDRCNLSGLVAKLAVVLELTGFIVADSHQDTESWHIWDFHDVLFHTRTRQRGDNAIRAGTYERQQEVGALDIDISKRWAPVSIDPITQVDWGASFKDILDNRSSIRGRKGAFKPASVIAILAALRKNIRLNEHNEREIILNPCRYPSAGALDELEFFWVHEGCSELNAGIYHFDKFRSQLKDVCSDQNVTSEILNRAKYTWGEHNGLPRGLIIITAHYLKIAAKYENIAYRLSLLNAGVALQTIYLIATAEKIGICALGTGDSMHFAQVIGFQESDHFALCEIAIAGALE